MIPSQHIFDKIIHDQSKSPLMENNIRGVFAEYLIADILGAGWKVKDGSWNEWDIDGPNGEKLEIKQSAFLQTWCKQNQPEGQYKISKPSFDIAAKTGYNSGIKTRPADIYIFALHIEKNIEKADHRILEQWEFYVVDKKILPKGQKRIGLGPISRLATPVRAKDLLVEIENVGASTHD